MIARILTYTVIAILAAFVIFTTFLLDRGGGSAQPSPQPEPDPAVISVHDLSIDPEGHQGKTVTTEGTLTYSEETQQYQVVDQDIAVVVNGYELEALNALIGQPVIVMGRFDFDAETGIYIDAETIEVKD